MYDYVCPEKLIHALEWLKANNPLYADVHVNMHWAAESQTCDSDLFHGLVMLHETNSHDCVPNNTPQEHTHEPCGDQKYISRLRNGAWGDHVAIQGISDRFNIAINVLSSEHSNMIRVIPRNGTIEHEVYVIDKLWLPRIYHSYTTLSSRA